ncbi:vascular endothelial growth factor receptor 1-like isoform X2 [Zootermopsis nevadensis]|nr:vascular endothelial growth factor receptor 1-like isoform X2 [Zootermopsis nevadensis]XP_021926552.1 vascular endothelial growth factor receptor 1-like isoform X2 [Zootermopsis nevadensis]
MIKDATGDVELSYTTENNYKGRLIIKDAVYTDTGYYYCVRNDTTECSLQMEGAQRKYIYVKDNENLLAGDSFCHVYAEVKRNAVLPCRPTSPDIKITLNKDEKNLSLGKQKDSNLNIAYDPTIGFTLENIGIFDSGEYKCVNEDMPFPAIMNLFVSERKPTYAMKPRISGPEHIIVRKGRDLVLECQGLSERGVNMKIMWFKSQKFQASTPQTSCKNGDYDCMVTFLRVMNVTDDDGGTYTCVINDKYNNTRNNSRTVKVIGENEVGITLKSDSNETIFMQVGQTKEVKMVVNVFAPENVTLKWYGPNGNQLHPDMVKYGIESKSDQTILKVFHPNLYDAGMYRLDAYNSIGMVSLKRLLIVQDKPNISLSRGLVLFPEYSVVNFSCVVWSPKPVEVKWFFKTCDLRKPGDCDNDDNFRQEGLSKHVKDSKEAYDVFRISLIVTQGILRCAAKNSFGNGNDSLKLYITDLPHVRETPHVWGEPDDVVMEGEDSFSVVEGDNFTLKCASSVYNNTHHPVWYTDRSTVHNSTGLKVITSKTEFLYVSNLEFINITKEQHTAVYSCYENNETTTPLGKQILVADSENAKIIETNLENMEVKLGDSLNITCRSAGMPEPITLWYKDGKLVINDKTVELTERNQSLKIILMKPENEGKYTCVVKNRLQEDSAEGYVTVTGKAGFSVTMVVITVVCAFVVVVLIIVLIVKTLKAKKLQKELNLAGLANFEKGALECINPELPVDEQADLLPYDRTWEFPREKLILGKQLGAGAFGVVMKAEAYGILDYEEKTTVAVKMVKSGADRAFIKALASELKIMTHLGKHLNVVNLLGASTKNLAKMELMVIVEFCRYGNIHNYLLRHRDDFIDQMDHTTGRLNLALGMEKLCRSQSSKSKISLKQRLLSYTSTVTGDSYSGGINSELHAPSTPRTTEMPGLTSDMAVVSSPTGEPDECLLSNSSSEQPDWRVKYRGDYKGSTMPVCSHDLFCWAFQVARGMEYLVSRKVLHGDLAARNILLADDNVVKICDFGLAKSMYKSDNYQKKTSGPLPVKWMALESIRDRIFSTQSDVWSFGIVLWELFSLAQTPYPGMEADERLFLKLVDGYRMEQPPFATNAIYRMMLQCWDASPVKRPSFPELAEQLGAMLDDSIRRHYEELNSQYVDMNERNLHDDYLSMMSAPNYSNIVAPQETQHEYVNSPDSCPDDSPRQKVKSLKSVVSPLLTDSVFDFSGEANNTGYLTMTGKEDIFSPGHVDENPFKYSPYMQKELPTEMKHLKVINIPSSDNYVNVGHKPSTETQFENPTYLMAK